MAVSLNIVNSSDLESGLLLGLVRVNVAVSLNHLRIEYLTANIVI